MRKLGAQLLTAVALMGAPALSGCGGSLVDCSKAAPTHTFVGRLAERRGATASFVVLEIRDPTPPVASVPVAPTLIVGRRVDVDYGDDRARFLRVGSTYLVEVFWAGYFRSDVRVASDPCSGGTVYADGRSIDTSSWWRSHVVTVLTVAAAISVIALAALAGAVRARRNRRRRRR